MKQINVKSPCYLAVRRELADIFIDLNKDVRVTVGLIVSGIYGRNRNAMKRNFSKV